MNLGEQLREQENKRKIALEMAAESKIREELAKKAEHQLQMVNFFDFVKNTVQIQISLDKPMKGVRLPNNLIGYGDFEVTKPNHEFNKLWYEFQVWCADNGLVGHLISEHDGMGMESWFAITVTPA